MKEKAAIFVMFIYLFGATDAYQLLKLPLLVTHFIKHKKESPHITLGSFFKMHYVDPQPMDADYTQDMQLPFKTPQGVFFRTPPTEITVFPKMVFNPLVENVTTRLLLNDDIPSILLNYSIFQPPRPIVMNI